jgi:fumarylacetoacetate (FAA) hydrolase
MKLGTIHNGTRDGQLAVVSRNLGTFVPATGIAASMQSALDAWEICEPALQALYADLNAGACGRRGTPSRRRRCARTR